MDAELTALNDQFFADLAETMDEVEANLLSLEERPDDPQRVHALFRAFHTVKGNAGLVGEPEIQSACHALESRLSAAREGTLPQSLIQHGFEALDLLRSCASSSSSSGCRDELRRLASAGEAAAGEPPAPETAGGRTVPADASGPPGAGSSAPGEPVARVRFADAPGYAPGRLDLASFRALVAGFAPVSRAYRRLVDAGGARARARYVEDLGMAVLDFSDAIPAACEPLRRIARYLEDALNLVIMAGIDYDPDRFPLVGRLVCDAEQYVKAELVEAPYLTSILVDDAAQVERLPDAVERLDGEQLIAVTIRVPFDVLARAGRNLERLRKAGASSRHTVFFIMNNDTRGELATRLLAEVLGDYPLVGTSVWEALLRSVSPEV